MAIVTIQPGPTRTKDAFTDVSQPTFNTGADDDLKIKHLPLGPSEQRTFVYIPLIGVPSNPIINSAKLQLYVRFRVVTNNTPTHIYRIAESWVEGSQVWGAEAGAISWNNSPSVIGGSLDDPLQPNAAGIWHEWEITNAVRDWVSGILENNGLRINMDQAPAGNNDFDYYSSDYVANPSLRPRIVLDYIPRPAARYHVGPTGSDLVDHVTPDGRMAPFQT